MAGREFKVARLEHDSQEGTWTITVSKSSPNRFLEKPDPQDIPHDVASSLIKWLYQEKGIDSGDAGSTKL